MPHRAPYAALLALGLLPSTALAQPNGGDPRPPCADYREVQRQLAASYGEAPVATGLRSNGELLQVFASPESGTWTIVSTTPQGTACVLAAGRHWEQPRPGGTERSA
jgi:hypothetical protein